MGPPRPKSPPVLPTMSCSIRKARMRCWIRSTNSASGKAGARGVRRFWRGWGGGRGRDLCLVTAVADPNGDIHASRPQIMNDRIFGATIRYETIRWHRQWSFASGATSGWVRRSLCSPSRQPQHRSPSRDQPTDCNDREVTKLMSSETPILFEQIYT